MLNRAGLMTALLLGVLSTAAPPSPATGVIEGVVLRLGTSEPLADVKVRVSPVNATWVVGVAEPRRPICRRLPIRLVVLPCVMFLWERIREG